MVSQACNPGSTQEVEPRVSRLSRLQGQLWQEPDPASERFGALFLHSVTCYLHYSFLLSHFPSPGLVQSPFFSLYSRLFGCLSLSLSLSPCPKQQKQKQKTISPKMERSGGQFLYCTPSHTRKVKGNFSKVLCVTREAQITGIGRLTHDHTVGLGLFFHL